MHGLNERFIEIFEPVLVLKGFKRKRNIFHRLINEKIIQIFSIKKFSGGTFTMQYAIIPLCSGEEIVLPLDENRIGDLVENESLWEWDIDENIEQNLLKALDICKKYLFKCFDYVKDYETYYNFILTMHKQYLDSLSKEKKRENESLLKAPITVGFYEVCLCLGEYQKAIISLEAMLYQRIYAIERNKKCGCLPTKRAINALGDIRTQINKTKDFQKGIRSPNTELKKNEDITLNSYFKIFGLS